MKNACISATDAVILQNQFDKNPMKPRDNHSSVYAFRISLRELLCFFAMAFLSACLSPLIPDEEKGGEQSGDTLLVVPDTVEIVHTGTARDEYTVTEAQAIGSTDTAVWVKGYVVGTVKNSMKSGCQFEPPFSVETNVLLADTFPTDWWHCMPVELPSGSIYQYALNLVDNPDAFHEIRRIQGIVSPYYYVPGIRNVTIVATYHPEGEESQGEVGDSIHGESLVNPLSVAEGVAAQGTEAYSERKWVKGYIVGVCTGKGKVTFADSLSVSDITTNGNVVLADSLGEDNLGRILVVQLSKGCIRDDVNLVDHPENLFRRLTVNGSLRPYYELPAVRDVLGTGQRTDSFGNPLYSLE